MVGQGTAVLRISMSYELRDNTGVKGERGIASVIPSAANPRPDNAETDRSVRNDSSGAGEAPSPPRALQGLPWSLPLPSTLGPFANWGPTPDDRSCLDQATSSPRQTAHQIPPLSFQLRFQSRFSSPPCPLWPEIEWCYGGAGADRRMFRK